MKWKNIEASPMQKVSNWRKMSIGVYGPQSDPTVYGILTQDCKEFLRYLKEVNSKSDVKATINQLLGRVIAIVLKEYPQLNGTIIRGRLYQRKTVDIFFQVDMSGSETELAGIIIRECENKSLIQITQEMRDKVKKLKEDKKIATRKTQSVFKKLPWQIIPLIFKFINFIQFTFNLNLEAIGIPRDTFGSIMINSIGSLNLETAFAPLLPIGRVPCLLGPGKIMDKPVVRDGEIVIRPMMNICITFDHRFMDGALAAKMSRRTQQILDDPFAYDHLISGLSGPSV